MRTIGIIIGQILYIGSGLLMFFFWLMAMSSWLGLLGTILAFVLAPGAIIFPLVFWFVEVVFPVSYFILWATGIVGIVITGIASSFDE